MIAILEEELRRTSRTAAGEATMTRPTPRRQTLARAALAIVAFGLVMALWALLWVPSVPLP
jgi:ferric-dicitrate binding protein FerR (iron transport regulator)